MKNPVVLSLLAAGLILLPTLSRADEPRWDSIRVYTLASGKPVAVAVPAEWQETSKTLALAPGAALRFLDESGRSIEIPAAALARASAAQSLLRAEELRKIALARNGS